ncbi:alpha/beta hydrolase [Tengunoibacter tsumagoiensis]|uniref:Alpha/beta hydrolase n=1 Tax=Tengunoibacter tsumagoiensis TaxID=2014871 RepID=A0A402A745_9CHLR|nr:alpha/beta hydrolase [Tengunoibacter tsumagoiensis]GCE14953.1 alpha/beta hydrolase [Tengunoibacter tsumagoiensis]
MEEPIHFQWQGETLLGVHHRPQRKDVPGVIFVHGLMGNRVDVRRLFVRLARHLYHSDIASLRIDFQASGVSDGTFHMMTYTNQLSQLLYVIEEVQRRALWGGPLILLGASQGAKLVIAAARCHPAVAGVCLWSGLLANEDRELVQIAPTNRKLRKIGKTIAFDSPWGVWCNKQLYSDFRHMTIHSPYDLPLIPLLGIYGDNDPATLATRAFLQQTEHELVVIPGGDHLLSQQVWEGELIESVPRWINKHFQANE